MKKRIVFACDTPLQVLNAINLKETHFAECEGTLFIYNQFQSAKEIEQRLQETNIFKYVYLVSKYKEYPTFLQKLATLKRLLFPYATLKKYTEGATKINKYKYSYVAFSFITTFSLTVFGMAKTDSFLQLEDGMGTYVGDILNDYTSGLFKKIITHTNYRNVIQPKKVCLYNPQMRNSDVPVLKLENNFSKEMCKKIEHVYGYKPNHMYENSRCIYLTQPFEETKGYIEKNGQSINKTLYEYRDETLVRLHPREKEGSYEAFATDLFKNLWELECIHQIGEKHILVGAFSTTQLMPKVLKNKEPYVVFLYKILFEDTENEYWQDITRFIDMFSSFYSKPERIYIPESVEEFKDILSKILEKEEDYE